MGRYNSEVNAERTPCKQAHTHAHTHTNQLHHSVGTRLSLFRAELLCQTGEVHAEQTLPLKSWLSSVWVGDARYPALALRQ